MSTEHSDAGTGPLPRIPCLTGGALPPSLSFLVLLLTFFTAACRNESSPTPTGKPEGTPPAVSSGPADDFIWIEAETPSAGNFPAPKDNPYRAREFWESDVLSGGDWIGMKWEDSSMQPFLEYTFDAPRSGLFQFYARKFYAFGNFRWKIDDGPWEHNPASDRFLDSVPFRENEERIRLNWFHIGAAFLTQGRHTLRIEPLSPKESGIPPHKYTPLAFDVFVFTPEPFLPNGKLKPGERNDVQTTSAFSMEPPADKFSPSGIDWLCLNGSFAGGKGVLALKDGRLVLRDSGDPVRLLGMNINIRAFANADSTTTLPRFLAKKGFNLARFDLAEVISASRTDAGQIRFQFEAAALDQLLHAIQSFKDNGIYTALTWNMKGSHGLLPLLWGENPVNADGRIQELRRSFSSLLYFDPSLRQSCREIWKTVLDARLPDGGRLGDEPALAFVTLNQQDSLLSESFAPYQTAPPEQMLPIEKAFAKWLASRPGFTDFPTLLKTWGGTPVKGDNPDEGRIGILGPAELATRPDTRSRDTAQFLAETQAAFFENMVSYLKNDLHFRGLVSTSNKLAENASVLGWINAWSQSAGDFTERHGNFLTHFEENFHIWNTSAGARYEDRSALRFDPLRGQETSRFNLPMRGLSIAGKPVFLSEISWPTPNRFRSEMPMLATTLASLQQIPVLAFNSLFTPYWQTSLTADRTPAFTPATMSQMPAFAYAFRMGLLPSGPVIATLDLTKDSAFSLRPQLLDENADTQLDAAQSAPGLLPDGAPHPAIWTAGRINVRLDATADRFEMTTPPAITDSSVEAAGDRVRWDFQTGLLVVDAPACKAVGGFLNRAGLIRFGGLEITSPMEYGVICLVALDGQPLESSKKILLQVFSEEANSGAYADGGTLKTIRSVGRAPILVKNLSGTVRFLRPDADSLIATALDDNGYKTLTAGIGSELHLLPATIYYMIEK